MIRVGSGSGNGNVMVGRVWWVKLKLLYFFFSNLRWVVEGKGK